MRYLSSIRIRLVLWYLAILAALLIGLGIFQSLTLSNYLVSTTGRGLHDAARSELMVLGPCFVRSPAQLRTNAQTLAQLLGSHDVGVKIVTRSGLTLADHPLGQPGATYPMRLSASTIRSLIRSTAARLSPPTSAVSEPACLKPTPSRRVHHSSGSRYLILDRVVATDGSFVLVAQPIGWPGHVMGYAILGRSLGDALDTINQARIFFVLGALAAILLAALVALPIINRSLRPLHRVADTAEAIAGGDLEKRANLAHSHDEVGRLGIAFDTMVDHLQDALATSTESEERMRRFLADASHELRTPITALRGTSEVLLRRGTTGQPDVDRSLRSMHTEAVRLSRLADDLLTLSRLDAGLSLDPQPVPVHSFLDRFVDRYSDIWPSRIIEYHSPATNGSVASVDPEALTRVLTNLVDNAAKYSRTDGRILITDEARDQWITIAVTDEGPGLEREEAARVFERFYRVNKSRARGSGGAGLGLAIVHALVEQSGGKVEIDTAPSRGTVVAVTIPRSDDYTIEPASTPSALTGSPTPSAVHS